MAIYGFPFGSMSGDRKYGIEIWQKLFRKIISSGVFMHDLANSFQLIEKAGMVTTLKIGYANLDGVFAYTDADTDLTHDAVAGVARDDLIVLRADYVDRDPEIVLYKNAQKVGGLYQLQRDGSAFEIAVAVVHLQSNSSAITQAMIEDLRLSDDYCGLVVSAVQTINTTDLYNQIQADLQDFKDVQQQDFEDWFASIQNIFDANAETNLLNLINARLKKDGSEKMTGDLQMGNHKVKLETAGGVLLGDIEPVADGVKINVYDAGGANPKALYIKRDGTMTLDGDKVWTSKNLIVAVGEPNVNDLENGDLYFQIIE